MSKTVPMAENSLRGLNTFGMEAQALSVQRIYNTELLREILKSGISPIRILGGGSNILITGDQPFHILKNEIKGIEIIRENIDEVTVKVGAGEVWHQLVLWSLSQNLGGLENLSLIPGSVGAAPMQNIGAYGVEQKMCFDSLDAVELKSGKSIHFSIQECGFGYRESIFKNLMKDQLFITHVTYTLTKRAHRLHLSYGAIRDVLDGWGIKKPEICDVSRAVIHIRKSKLPDPLEIGNAGSFFKNPEIDDDQYQCLLAKFPDIVGYPQKSGLVKVAAGWLIEKAGFKGFRRNQIGVHKDQALVLVNYGGGSGKEILELSKEIQLKIHDQFGITLQPEVNIW